MAGTNALATSTGITAIFPVWNIFTAIVLVTFWRYDIINESNISDKNTNNVFEIFTNLAIAAAILIICQYLFNMHWSEIYSICVVYASSLNPVLSKLFN